jgi:tetratricopeptide (TPR) repeat protein
MAKMNLMTKGKKMQGQIGYYGLEEWWFRVFTEDERNYMKTKFRSRGEQGVSLEVGDISFTSQSSVSFLHNLASWFTKENERHLAYQLIEKAEEHIQENEFPVLDRHFLFQQKIVTHYKDREKPGNLKKAVEACYQQITLSEEAATAFRKEYGDGQLPAHKGYQQLAIILDKQGEYDEAIEICQRAIQQGWSGDWENRIKRYMKKCDKFS